MAGKRSFYEDDEWVINKPGYNVEISPELKEQESSHGRISFIHGMGIRTAPYLEQYVNKTRLWVHSKASLYEAEFQTQRSAFWNEWNSISSSIQSTIKEPVLPGLIYILTGTLTGSILVNRRSLPLRFLSPLVFGAASTAYFAPKTFDTWTSKYEDFEKSNFPEFNQQKHDVVIANYYKSKAQVENSISEANVTLQKQVHDARVYLEELLK